MSNFTTEMHKTRFRLGLRPRSRWGSEQLSEIPYMNFLSFPTVSKVAEVYLGMSAASVPVDDMFSSIGLISNGKRSSIGPQKLNRVLLTTISNRLAAFAA
jgi:hypothetical protein